MKKSIKSIFIIVLSLLITVCSVVPAFAETVYVVDGYSYTVTGNLSMTLVDWDTKINSYLTVPDKLANRYFTAIGNWAFENDTDLTGLDLSHSEHLSSIGYECFIGCSGISNDIVFPDSLTTLNDRCFSECTSIPTVTINEGITVVPTECFYSCTSLTMVNLPETLQTIRSWAFGNCTALEYVEIPKSVTTIANSAFLNDPNLTLGVYYNSYAYQYAKDNNIPYVLLDGALLGDANGDGYVNVNDVTAIQRHAAELEPLEGICFHAADVDGDGDVSVDDATELQRFLAEFDDVPYPIGEVMTQ